jgi:hypothetical protein
LINAELNDNLLKEGFAREFVRNVQDIRKKLDLSRFKEQIVINFKSDIDIEKEFGEFVEYVKEETGCVKFGKEKKGKPFSIKIQNKKIDILIQVSNN